LGGAIFNRLFLNFRNYASHKKTLRFHCHELSRLTIDDRKNFIEGNVHSGVLSMLALKWVLAALTAGVAAIRAVSRAPVDGDKRAKAQTPTNRIVAPRATKTTLRWVPRSAVKSV
jgi:hypothetical protein